MKNEYLQGRTRLQKGISEIFRINDFYEEQILNFEPFPLHGKN